MAAPKGISAPQAVNSAMSLARGGSRSVRTHGKQAPDHPPYASLALISAAAMAYELLLSRLLAIIQWPHVAFMILSVALLGYGVAGAVLSLTQRRLLRDYNIVYLGCVAAFGVSSVLCFIAIEQIPFDVQEALSTLRQPLKLLLIYLLLSIPFTFVAGAVMLTLANFNSQLVRTHAAFSIGSGCGVLLILALLYIVVPDNALRAVGALVFAAAAVAWWERRVEPNFGSAIFALLGLALILLPGQWTELQVTTAKSLSQALAVGGANLITERSSPLGTVSVVENSLAPWHYAPGLSLRAPHDPPEQVGVFTDGDALTVITRPANTSVEMDYLAQTTSALPYHLRELQHVLVLGAGGGNDVLQARFHHVPLIEAVELNPQIPGLLRGDYRDFSGDLYGAPDVKLHVAEPRSFIARSTQRYDLIQISLLDNTASATSGLYTLGENYTYTVDAFRDYLAHLEPGGFLAITRWVNLPPRDTLKLFVTAATALERNGILDPGEQIFLIRSWQTATLVVKNGPYTTHEIAAMQEFCRKRGFDLGYYTGMKEEDSNLFNVTDRAYFFNGTQSLLSAKRDAFLGRYKYRLNPATDDRPFYYHFFKWKNFSELIAPRDKGGIALMEWSYPVLAFTLLQTLLIGSVVVLAPLLFSRQLLREIPHGMRVGKLFVFCLCSGMAVMALQIAFVQKFTQLLHHPILVIAVVLSTFLIFSGLGNFYAQRIADARHHMIAVWWSVAVAGILSLVYLNGLSLLFDVTLAWPLLVKIALTVALLAPLAFCLGMPLPLALDQISDEVPALLPWSWGLTQCARVVGASGSMVLANHLGFTMVSMISIVFLGIAAWTFPSTRR